MLNTGGRESHFLYLSGGVDRFGDIRTPPAAQSALDDVAEVARREIVSLKARATLPRAVNEKLAELEDLLNKVPQDRCATYHLPEALSSLDLAAQESNSSDVSKDVKTLVYAVITKLANAATYNLENSPQLTVIGEGRSNWVLSDHDKKYVVIIPKVVSVEGFNNLKLRRWVGKLIHDLDQPKIHRIATLPILHGVGDFAQGESISAIFKRSKEQKEISSELREAVQAVGKLMRQISAKQVERYGRPRSTSEDKGRWRGARDHLRHSQGKIYKTFLTDEKPEAIRAYMLNNNVISEALQDHLSQMAKKLFRSDRPPMLAHLDPHFGNFLYNAETKQVTALDWDSATFTSEARMLGRFYHFFSQYSEEDGKVRETLFRNFLSGYEQEPEKREALYKKAIYSATIDFYAHLDYYIAKEKNAKGIEPSPESLPLLERTLVGRIKCTAKMLERWQAES
jgi:hypothetical protein